MRLFKILGLLYLACGARAFAADFTLAWDANSESTVAGYKLYYGTASRSYLTNIDVGNKSSYAVTGLGAGTYYFAVTVYDILGNESGFSNEVIMAATICSAAISPSSRAFGYLGGVGGVAVTTASGCDWTAVSNVSWITVPPGIGSGNAAVDYTVAANTTTSPRTGTLTVAGQTHTVTQAGSTPSGITCSYSLSLTTDDSDFHAFEGATDVTTGPGCQWTASSNVGWITIVSPTQFPVTGNTTVTYSVQENTSSTRTGTLTIAGRTFTVTQMGVTGSTCSFTVSPAGQSLGAGAAVSNVSVTAPSGCRWTAANTASWVTISSGSSGSGDGTVTYSVTANTSSSSRKDTLTIAGKSFTVTQASPSPDTCVYNISSATQSFPYTGGSGTIALTAPSGCRWTVTDVPLWIKITSAGDGSGSTEVSYTVEQNRQNRRRKAKVMIADQLFTVKQDGKNHAIFAQVANGAQWVSSVVLTNPSTTETAAGSVSFHNDRGEPLPVSLKGQPPAERVSFTIQPLGRATFVSDGGGDLVSGSALVSSDNPVSGVVVYSHPDLGTAGVGVSSPLRSLMTPVQRDQSRGLNTGIALRNTQDSPVELKFSLRTLDGREVAGGSSSEIIPAGGHRAKFVDQLFPAADTASFQGTLVVGSAGMEEGVAATAIQIGGSVGGFTTLPVIPVDPEPAMTELFFAQFVDGADWTSTLLLTNPKATAIGSQLTFYDDQGRLLPISVGGQSPSPEVSLDIQPRGAAVLSTGGNGVLVSGSARVTAGSAIAGVLSFAFGNLGMAGVMASVPGDGFIAPVERSASGISSTGVAIASAGLPVKLILTLRDERGTPVPGGRAVFELPANGHLARFLEQLFPNAETAEFLGTVTVTAEGGSIIGTVLQLRGKGGLLTALPVTLLQ